VQVNVSSGGTIEAVSAGVRLASREGAALFGFVILLGALLFALYRADRASQEVTVHITRIEQSLDLAERRDERILLLLDQQNATLQRLEAKGGGG
jgi:hypothetical protein